MKKLFLILSSIFLLCACSKDEPSCPQNPDNSSPTENVYYVRYEVKMYVPERRFKLNVTYTTETGEKSISLAGSTWEGTYGPFKKGQTVHLSASTSGVSSNLSTNYVRIYVSCNNSPFGIKSEKNEDYNYGLSTSYTFQ